MHQPAHDLFGEVPVLESDLFAWVSAVSPRWLVSERSYLYYVRGWDVAGKVQAAKAAGCFDVRTEPAEPPWHEEKYG